ncbi:MAG: radical SAM family heme chaperone HemW [Firmicutes bacterium]|nr:radical SAM family heme chaperone HemW [Bacillota bacterium]
MKVGLYIHIPFCRGSKCPYCDFVSVGSDFSLPASLDMQKKYVAALIREVGKRCGEREYTVETVYVGGGTPSALYRGGLTEIINAVKNVADFTPVEFSVEANPESADKGFFDECAALRVDRISFGLQSTEDNLLKGLRRHTYRDFLLALGQAKEAEIKNVSADLMLGLSGQTYFDVEKSVQKLIGLRLKHISVYGLKVEEGTPLYESGFLVDEDKTADFYDIIHKRLKEAGYSRYEVSNFALPSFECRHNRKYWDLSPYLGVGPSACSYLDGFRTKNTGDLARYIRGEFLESTEDVRSHVLTEYIMLGLRTAEGVELKTLADMGMGTEKLKIIDEFILQGCFVLRDGRACIAEPYLYVMNSIVSRLI